jgi:orotate phosphoribosyltransferase
VQEVIQSNQIPVCAIANLNDLMEYLQNHADLAHNLHSVAKYRQTYGVD